MKKVVLICLLFWLTIFLLQKIDLTTTDLGRHLENGKLILSGDFNVLKENLYSYTNENYPFLNHHWLSGVIFYPVFRAAGFTGLHIFSIVLTLITFLIFFLIAKKESNIKIASVLSFLLIPLMASRKEIRPEVFTSLFAAIFFAILWRWRRNGKIHPLFILPFIEILWVNAHIYFFLGPLILGTFLLEKIVLFLKQKVGKKEIKILFFFLALCILASFINPFGWKNVVHPFRVYENYGYRVLEEQSVLFLEKLNVQNPNFLLFKISLALLIFIFALLFFRKKFKEYPWLYIFSAAAFTFAACWAIRNFSLFGFFILPSLACSAKIILQKIKPPSQLADMALTFIVLAILIFTALTNLLPLSKTGAFGLGLLPSNNISADFFKKEDVNGPIFNNYDIGGYLIYRLFPQEKIFVDNRPEAYPASFFQETYVPMQEDENVWREQEKKYNFNTIFFAYHDATPWAQKFLADRLNDASWAPVFADNYAIIFLKRNEKNKNIIEKYELPKNYFTTQ